MEKDHLFETKPFLKTQCVLLVQVHLADNLLRTDRNVVLPAILFVKEARAHRPRGSVSGDDDQAVPIRFERIEINQPVRRGKHAVGRKIDRAAGRVQSLLALVLIFTIVRFAAQVTCSSACESHRDFF